MNNYTKGEMTLTDWETTAKQMFGNKIAVGKIVERVAKMRPDVPIEQVQADVIEVTGVRTNLLRTVSADKPVIVTPQGNGKVVGVFSDIHTPFDHPNYLRFLDDTFGKYNVTDIVLNGDIVDFHAISRHPKEPCAKGAYPELDEAIARLKEYARAFPRLRWTIGNHDGRPEMQAATVGIGKRFLMPIQKILELPDGWECVGTEIIIDNVLYKHGIGWAGKDAAYNAAINEQMSTVIGHTHAYAGCKYAANKRNLIFGLNTGCGIDISAYAFVYGEHAPKRPILGCGIVFSDTDAVFVPMKKQYFRTAD